MSNDPKNGNPEATAELVLPDNPIPMDVIRHLQKMSLRLTHNGETININLADVELQNINIIDVPLMQPRHQARNAKWFKCGNCLQRIRQTGDAQADHHAIMTHVTDECPKRAEGIEATAQLIDEHNRQQRQLAEASTGAAKAKRFKFF